MDLKWMLWYGVLGAVTTAYLIALSGISAARSHDVPRHAHRMMAASVIVGLWLIVYVTKQLIFGKEQFGGSTTQYWGLYVPVFATHMAFAVSTMAIGAYNLSIGIRRIQHGSVGAMSAHLSRHRRLGRWLLWTFSGTMATAYALYLLLFVFYPA